MTAFTLNCLIKAVIKMGRPYPKFTYEDYLLLPEDKHYELIEGELVMVPSPGRKHQRVLGRLYQTLSRFLERKNLGELYMAPFDIMLSPTVVVQPDLLFVSRERLLIITEANIQGPPDLVAEILSSDHEKDRGIKKKLYAKFGVEEYWIVDPEGKSIEVMELEEKGFRTVGIFKSKDVLTTKTFPGLNIKTFEVFS